MPIRSHVIGNKKHLANKIVRNGTLLFSKAVPGAFPRRRFALKVTTSRTLATFILVVVASESLVQATRSSFSAA